MRTDLTILQSEHSPGGEGDARGEVDGLQPRGPGGGDWSLTKQLKLPRIRKDLSEAWATLPKNDSH